MYYGERLNSITHLIGAVLALVGFGALLTISIQSQQPLMVLGFVVFGLSLIQLYTMSTLYHSLPFPRVKRIFQKLDHVSIYLLIAGTYTPYMLLPLWDSGGMEMLIVIWTMAVFGLLLDLFVRRRIEWLQIMIYLVMGWVCTLNYGALRASVPTAGVIWLTIGGMAYTLGVIFYVLDNFQKLRHAHGIWHLFVLAGSLCHFISIVGYVR